MMTMKKNSAVVAIAIMMLVIVCVFPVPTAAEASKDSKDSKESSKSKDPKAEAAVKEICKTMTKPENCEQFLVSSPNPDPTHMVKFNLRVLKSLVEEGTYVASKDELKNPSTPEKMKKSLHTCAQVYEKAVIKLDAANDACADCYEDVDSSKDKKCSAANVKKINSMLKEAVLHFEKCGEALGSAGSPPKPWTKELNEAMIDGAHILMAVAKEIK